MTDSSPRDFLSRDNCPIRFNSHSDEDSFHYYSSPNRSPKTNKASAKLRKFLQSTDINTSNSPQHLGVTKNKKDRPNTKRNSFRNNESKELINDKDLILDPLCERSLLTILKGLKQKICKLGLSRTRASKGINLVLIKSHLKMRRKSDVSRWAGGVSRLEKVTPFLVYDYALGMTLQDVSYRHEMISPGMRKSFDRPSFSRQKNERENNSNSPNTSTISPSLSPERRELDSIARYTVFSLVAPDNSLKSCNLKDINVVYLEDEVKSEDDKADLAKFKELLTTVGIGNGKVNKTAVILINKECIKDAVNNNETPSGSILLRNGETRADAKKTFEPINNVSKTVIEKHNSMNDKVKRQISTIVNKTNLLSTKKSIFEKKEPTQAPVYLPPAPVKANSNLAPLIKTKSHRGHSQDNSVTSKTFDLKAEEKERKISNNNAKMQTLSKKKLAEIVCPEKPRKTINDFEKNNSMTQNPRVIAMSFREPRYNVGDKYRPIFIKDDKQPLQSHRVSPLLWFNGSLIDDTYNKHNIKKVAALPKARKYSKSPLAEELMPLNQRKYVWEKTYGGSKPVVKMMAKKNSVPHI